MWEKIKKYAGENPMLAVAAVSGGMVFFGLLFKIGILSTMIITGVVGLCVVFVKWLIDL